MLGLAVVNARTVVPNPAMEYKMYGIVAVGHVCLARVQAGVVDSQPKMLTMNACAFEMGVHEHLGW